jgi:Fe-S cluster assembly protein SufD
MTALLKPTGSPPERFTSRNPDDFAVPSTRDEDWRFTPLARVRGFFDPFEPDAVIEGEHNIPRGVTIDHVDPQTVPTFGSVLTPADRVAAIAMSRARSGLHVRIAPGAEPGEPVLIRRTGVSGRGYAHHVIEVGANAHATIVLDEGGELSVAENVEVIVGEGAGLTLVSVNAADPGSVQLTSHAALVGRDATYRHINATLGGDVVRILPTVRFAGRGGRAELIGVSFAESGQHLESRLFVDHSVPDCSSNVLYKNALQGNSARTVWIGDVRIRPSATGTDTYELNRNLLLSDGARADSVPNLEIETGEIAGAGHASATGRFDDLQLFYLQSRGIPEHEARRLVVRGFFADIVHRIGLPDLEERLMTAIETRLGASTEENETEKTEA